MKKYLVSQNKDYKIILKMTKGLILELSYNFVLLSFMFITKTKTTIRIDLKNHSYNFFEIEAKNIYVHKQKLFIKIAMYTNVHKIFKQTMYYV